MTLDELDKLAAEKIAGFTEIYEDHNGVNIMVRAPNGFVVIDTLYQPTRNIAQAWELLEKLNHLFAVGKIMPNSRMSGALYSVELYGKLGGQTESHASGKSAPEAITRACLKAVGVEID